jgi:hypothetical protein
MVDEGSGWKQTRRQKEWESGACGVRQRGGAGHGGCADGFLPRHAMVNRIRNRTGSQCPTLFTYFQVSIEISRHARTLKKSTAPAPGG